MSYITDRSEVKVCPNPGLTVTWCGWQKCYAGHEFGPSFYKDYAITFVLDGCGSYTLEGKTYQISKGMGFVIFPDKQISYVADQYTPWEYVFSMFHGADVPTLLSSVGISAENPVFQFENNEEIRDILDRQNIRYKYKVKDQLGEWTGSGTLRGRVGSAGNPAEQAKQYEILVDRKNLEQARFAIQK